ncbi:hypothetical protein Ddc_19108 [Ditylenchus destructor]|nr:hypothetical protein Ddc_19108 [Ditylenchus destructor]
MNAGRRVPHDRRKVLEGRITFARLAHLVGCERGFKSFLDVQNAYQRVCKRQLTNDEKRSYFGKENINDILRQYCSDEFELQGDNTGRTIPQVKLRRPYKELKAMHDRLLQEMEHEGTSVWQPNNDAPKSQCTKKEEPAFGCGKTSGETAWKKNGATQDMPTNDYEHVNQNPFRTMASEPRSDPQNWPSLSDVCKEPRVGCNSGAPERETDYRTKFGQKATNQNVFYKAPAEPQWESGNYGEDGLRWEDLANDPGQPTRFQVSDYIPDETFSKRVSPIKPPKKRSPEDEDWNEWEGDENIRRQSTGFHAQMSNPACNKVIQNERSGFGHQSVIKGKKEESKAHFEHENLFSFGSRPPAMTETKAGIRSIDSWDEEFEFDPEPSTEKVTKWMEEANVQEGGERNEIVIRERISNLADLITAAIKYRTPETVELKDVLQMIECIDPNYEAVFLEGNALDFIDEHCKNVGMSVVGKKMHLGWRK